MTVLPSSAVNPSARYRHLYRTQRWRRLAAYVVANAGYRCQMTPGCTEPAVSADHIIPVARLAELGRLDLFYAPSNLRAACRRCNSRAGAQATNARYRGRRRRMVNAEQTTLLWAAEQNRYWALLELERQDRERADRQREQRTSGHVRGPHVTSAERSAR